MFSGTHLSKQALFAMQVLPPRFAILSYKKLSILSTYLGVGTLYSSIIKTSTLGLTDEWALALNITSIIVAWPHYLDSRIWKNM